MVPETDTGVSPAIQAALFAKVRQFTGIAMTDRKWTLLHGRLRRRLQALALSSYGEYLAVLDSSSDEVDRFIDVVTTNETSFFRTPRIWDYLWHDFFPTWHAIHPGGILRIWSAAASTGEEAYSLAMLCEEFRETHTDFQYRILGTDIATGVVEAGRIGDYQGRNIDGLRKVRPCMLEKYFLNVDEVYTVAPNLRATVNFRIHNLYQRLNDLIRFDLVLLRNVLIYFDGSDQEAVLENVRHSMTEGGVLVVGESESLSRLHTGFAYQQPLIYRNDRPSA